MEKLCRVYDDLGSACDDLDSPKYLDDGYDRDEDEYEGEIYFGENEICLGDYISSNDYGILEDFGLNDGIYTSSDTIRNALELMSETIYAGHKIATRLNKISSTIDKLLGKRKNNFQRIHLSAESRARVKHTCIYA